jgi:hypothetical protein
MAHMNSAEKFVREVLEESFGQKANKKTVRTLAEQVSRSILISSPSRRAKRERV